MEFIKHPIVNDPLYQSERKTRKSKFGHFYTREHLALHIQWLEGAKPNVNRQKSLRILSNCIKTCFSYRGDDKWKKLRALTRTSETSSKQKMFRILV